MVLATSIAVSKDLGLLATFGGLGVIVTGIIIYMAVQLRGEHHQNREYIASLAREDADEL